MPSSGSTHSMTSINCLVIKSRRLMRGLSSGTNREQELRPVKAMLRCGSRRVNGSMRIPLRAYSRVQSEENTLPNPQETQGDRHRAWIAAVLQNLSTFLPWFKISTSRVLGGEHNGPLLHLRPAVGAGRLVCLL